MIDIGASKEATFTVQPSDTAEGLSISPEDSFPAVFATSMFLGVSNGDMR